ncbi:tetracycline resistance efflux system leader peptide [Corynebacterium glucuronolyticum]|uniref:Uncharacterized protein n=1 Tax=Corynebacterium glucuronolyticum TaxID=39791 RepID=A0A7T4EI08_9CORY|nr:hypothetical protein I6I10_09845 [Corynebacterium glucuronolyticum]QQU89686.1 hypothetical protein I6I68_06930 [Corynebacterium glucuronolyticum]QRO83736.1 hypothetical protein I6J20_03860 [Corynebacterium glucuronolyticum]QRP71851.1 hypothetical protein I6J21_06295 [Corynebacterium glucuronolyticum]
MCRKTNRVQLWENGK